MIELVSIFHRVSIQGPGFKNAWRENAEERANAFLRRLAQGDPPAWNWHLLVHVEGPQLNLHQGVTLPKGKAVDVRGLLLRVLKEQLRQAPQDYDRLNQIAKRLQGKDLARPIISLRRQRT